MPNSYSGYPAVITGNLTVTGEMLSPGPGASEVAIGSDSLSNCRIGVDIDAITGLYINNGREGFAIVRESGNVPVHVARRGRNSSAGVKTVAFPLAEFVNGVQTVNTGNVTENTIYSTLIEANTLGINGHFRVIVYVNVTAQGATATTVRLRLAGVLLASVTLATVADRLIEFIVMNINAPNSQRTIVVMHSNGASPALAFSTSAADSSVDATLTLTSQCGAATDSQTFQGAHGVMLPAGAVI